MNKELRRRILILLLVVAAGRVGAFDVSAQETLSALAALKTAAEKGDASAQDKLGEVYRTRQDEANALIWYRKAAKQGVANSQSQLGRILIGYARNLTTRPQDGIAHAEEAIHWLLKAARQGDKRAQVGLAREFQAGTFIKQDLVEAYAWYARAAEGGSPLQAVALKAASARDAIILKLPQEQIAEGRKRFAALAAGQNTKAEVPEPTWVREIRLRGLSGGGTRRLAIINGLTFEKGEEASIKAGAKTVKIRCVEIKESSTVISIEGLEGDRELQFALN